MAKVRRSAVLISLVLLLLTFATFRPVLDHDFVNFDDPLYVTENPQTQAGLTLEGIGWAFTELYASNWHPLTFSRSVRYALLTLWVLFRWLGHRSRILPCSLFTDS